MAARTQIGCLINSEWRKHRLTDLSDALVFVVAIPNLVGLYLMAPIVRRELARYRPPA